MDVITNKVHIESVVSQAQKGVLKDHSAQLDKLQRDYDFV